MRERHNNCPSCGHVFNSVARRHPRMTWPARFIFLAGVVIGLPWAILMIAVSLGTVMFVPPDSEKFVTWLKFAFGPGYLLAKYGYELPRMRRMRCVRCGWDGEVAVSPRAFGKR